MAIYFAAMQSSRATVYYLGARPSDCVSGSVAMPADVRAACLAEVPASLLPLSTTTGDGPSGSPGSATSSPSNPRRSQSSSSPALHPPVGTELDVPQFSGLSLLEGDKATTRSNSSSEGGGGGTRTPDRRQSSMDLGEQPSSGPADMAVTLKEGLLLVQRPGSSAWQRRHCVLNRRQLVYFSTSGRTAAGSIAVDKITRVLLRASSDFAIEITVDYTDVYTFLADTMQVSEAWTLALLSSAKPLVRDQLVPPVIHVALPTTSGTHPVPVTAETIASDVLKYLREKYDDPRLETCSVCLKRGDRLVWLDEGDRVLNTLVIFQSHVVELRRNSERDNMDRARAATNRVILQRPPNVEGYLMKQGADGPVRAWRKRFFFSQGAHLFYTKNHPSRSGSGLNNDVIGFINLESALSIDGDPKASFLDIPTPGRVYRLQAANREEMALWLVLLRKIRDFYRYQSNEMAQRMQSWSAVVLPSAFSLAKREGPLWKRGYYNRTWKERYFILSDGHLSYFDSRESTNQRKGRITLAGSHVVTMADEEPFVFSIVTSGRSFILRAASQTDLEEWLAEIDKEK